MVVMGYLKEAKERLMEETPDFHKKNRKLGIGIAGIGAVLKIAGAFFPAAIPVSLIAWSGELIFLGLSAAGVSSLSSRQR